MITFPEIPSNLRILPPLKSNSAKQKSLHFCFWHKLLPFIRVFHEELPSILIFALQQLKQVLVFCLTPQPLQRELWPIFTTTFVFFLFSSSSSSSTVRLPASVYVFIYALFHFLQKKKSQQHKHRQCKCKVCNAESPFAKCICAPLFTWNKEDGLHYPGQWTSHRWVTVVWLTW